MNIHETNGRSVTEGLPDFASEAIRRELIALRARLGSNTPAGHRCSNLVEQLEHYRAATGDQQAHLAKSIVRQMDELDALQLEAKYGTVVPGITTPEY